MSEENYKQIASHYENCFDKHGPGNKGVDWPNQDDLNKRFRVMTDILPTLRKFGTKKKSLLDFGCGTGLLLDWIRGDSIDDLVTYDGCDISEKFIAHCKQKDSSINFFQVDAIKTPDKLPEYDYIIMNGVLTMKMGLTFDEMWGFTQKLITTVFQKAREGIAFNLMSKQVDWERDDLFHVPLDLLASFLTKNLSRHFVIRNDYGLYEYTVYLFKQPIEVPKGNNYLRKTNDIEATVGLTSPFDSSRPQLKYYKKGDNA